MICKFKHFKQLFSLQNSKTTYYEPFQLISTVFNFSVRLVYNDLNVIFDVVFHQLAFEFLAPLLLSSSVDPVQDRVYFKP